MRSNADTALTNKKYYYCFSTLLGSVDLDCGLVIYLAGGFTRPTKDWELGSMFYSSSHHDGPIASSWGTGINQL